MCNVGVVSFHSPVAPVPSCPQKKGKKIDPRIEQNVALSKFAKSECAAGGALLQSLSVLLPPRSAKCVGGGGCGPWPWCTSPRACVQGR